MDKNKQTIVLDNGSRTIKAGFSGYDAPAVAFASVTGVPKYSKNTGGRRTSFIGDDAQIRRHILSLTNVIQKGIIQDWDAIEDIWNYTFYRDLNVEDMSEHGLVMADSPLNPESNQRRMTQMMFESFGVQRLYRGIQPIFSLYSSGRTLGCVIEMGHEASYAVATQHEPYPSTIETIPVCGKDLTETLCRLLCERGCYYSTNPQKELICRLKEKLGYVAIDYTKELSMDNAALKTYQLPDGNSITVGNEIFTFSEDLFTSHKNSSQYSSVQNVAYALIQSHGQEEQELLLRNIVLSGGPSLLPGFAERLKNEISELASIDKDTNVKVEISQSTKPQYSAWIGGSILGSLSCFEEVSISHDDYDENGPDYILEKCA